MLTGGTEDCHLRRMETLFQRRIMRSRPQPPRITPPREGRSPSWINNIVGPRYNILLEEKGDKKSNQASRKGFGPTFEGTTTTTTILRCRQSVNYFQGSRVP